MICSANKIKQLSVPKAGTIKGTVSLDCFDLTLRSFKNPSATLTNKKTVKIIKLVIVASVVKSTKNASTADNTTTRAIA